MPGWGNSFMRSLLIILYAIVSISIAHAQCTGGINVFPYREGFEISDGGWQTGGVGSDWAWGTPNKAVIQNAATGSRCWIVGNLTGNSYTNSEASWLQSPCFDFSGLSYPYISMKVFWETEQQFDGASFQYSLDNGSNWITIGGANETSNCLNTNWYNQSSINYLAPLTGNRAGWSGNIQSGSGSCRGGGGSNGWVVASHILPMLGGESSVIFRFIFGAGTICNSYDGFAVDDIQIQEASAGTAAFSYSCQPGNMVRFVNASDPCPVTFNWDFGDAGSGIDNISNLENPSHTFSGPGVYRVTLTVSNPGNGSSVIGKDIGILSVATTILSAADCQLNNTGSVSAVVSGSTGPFSYSWNSNPVQNTATANFLQAGDYLVTVESPVSCPARAEVSIPIDNNCTGVFFPSAFTPNGDGKNESFGAIGSIGILSSYRLRVYSRWGECVFESTDPLRPWNGRVYGKPVDTGLFAWFAEYAIQGQSPVLKKGMVAVIR
jgi:gliding motility-associated-like protein